MNVILPVATETVPLSPATSSVIRSEPAHELDQLPPGTDGLHPLIVPILTVTASAILASIIAITITRLSGRPLQVGIDHKNIFSSLPHFVFFQHSYISRLLLGGIPWDIPPS